VSEHVGEDEEPDHPAHQRELHRDRDRQSDPGRSGDASGPGCASAGEQLARERARERTEEEARHTEEDTEHGAERCADESLTACADTPGAVHARDQIDGGGNDGVATSFATDVEPLLVPACQMCHAPGQMAGDTQLLFTGTADTDYTTVLMFVDTSAPAGSRLLSKMAGNGHQGGTVYAAGSPEYQTVLHWIEQGAPQ